MHLYDYCLNTGMILPRYYQIFFRLPIYMSCKEARQWKYFFQVVLNRMKRYRTQSLNYYLLITISQSVMETCVIGWMDFFIFVTLLVSLHKIALFGILVVNLRNEFSKIYLAISRQWQWHQSWGPQLKSWAANQVSRPEFLDLIAFLYRLLLTLPIQNPRMVLVSVFRKWFPWNWKKFCF